MRRYPLELNDLVTRTDEEIWRLDLGYMTAAVDREPALAAVTGEDAYGAGLYFVGPGATMHTFPREMHVLEASYDRQESDARAREAFVLPSRQSRQ